MTRRTSTTEPAPLPSASRRTHTARTSQEAGLAALRSTTKMLVQAVKGHWKFVTSCALPMIGKSIVEGWRTGPLIREGEYAEAQELFDAARERGMSPFEEIFVEALERAVERVEALERRWWEE